MPKRFTDSEKWKDPFFIELSANYKLVWLYLLDDCNHAGIWKKSIKRLNFDCETNFTEQEILKTFGDRIIVLSEDKWFIPKFVYFQHGKDFIKSKQKQAESAIKILNEYNLLKENGNGSITLNLPLSNPTPTLTEPLPNPIPTLTEGFPNPYGNGNGNDNGIGNANGSGDDNAIGIANASDNGSVENTDTLLTEKELHFAETSLEAILNYGSPGQIAISNALENINDLGGLEKCLIELKWDYIKAERVHNNIHSNNWVRFLKHGTFDIDSYYKLYMKDFQQDLEI